MPTLTALPAARQDFPSGLDETAIPSPDELTDGELPSLLSRPPVIRLLDLTCSQVLHSQLKERLLTFLGSHAARLEVQMKNQVRANLDRLK